MECRCGFSAGTATAFRRHAVGSRGDGRVHELVQGGLPPPPPPRSGTVEWRIRERLAVARELSVPFACVCGFTCGVASALEGHLRRNADAPSGAHAAMAAPPALEAPPAQQQPLPQPAQRAAAASPRRAAAKPQPRASPAKRAAAAAPLASPPAPSPRRSGRGTPRAAAAASSAGRRKRGAEELSCGREGAARSGARAASSSLASPECASTLKRLPFMQDGDDAADAPPRKSARAAGASPLGRRRATSASPAASLPAARSTPR